MIPRTIHAGQKFIAKSKGLTSVWEVTRRVKTDDINMVWTKCTIGTFQERKYTGKQFGFLIRRGIVKLV